MKYLQNTGSSAVPAFVEVTGSGNPFDGFSFPGSVSPELADLDGDKDRDALVGGEYLKNTGTSTAPAFLLVTGSADPFDAFLLEGSIPALVDFDGDGDLDLSERRV